ncbi:MAG: hypothetical protein U0175_22315 [Caldilineaceae bacterium]
MILILTGPPAAGKSTLGPLIAKHLKRCAVIDVDRVRLMVAQPHVPPWRGEEGMRQLCLGADNACLLAHNFRKAGFHVVILDVLTVETAEIYRSKLAPLEHQIVLLLPTLEQSLQRNQARGQWLTDEEVRLLYTWEEQLTEYDRKIDNSYVSAEELALELAGLC